MSETTQETATCEYLTGFEPIRFCGKVAVSRYPAMGGGYMHLCIEHGKKHTAYAEPCYTGEAR